MHDVARRKTEQKAAVRVALESSSDFVGAQELHALMKQQGSSVGLATVYRQLNDMVSNGEADVLLSGKNGQLFRSCGDGHHHHLICVECGKTLQVLATSEDWVDELAEGNGFSVVRHVVEIFGICADCQRRPDISPTPAPEEKGATVH